jgi:hypothetical protein
VKARILGDWSLRLQENVMIGVELKWRLEINEIDARIDGTVSCFGASPDYLRSIGPSRAEVYGILL